MFEVLDRGEVVDLRAEVGVSPWIGFAIESSLVEDGGGDAYVAVECAEFEDSLGFELLGGVRGVEAVEKCVYLMLSTGY